MKIWTCGAGEIWAFYGGMSIRTPTNVNLQEAGGIDLLETLTSAAKEFWRGRQPGRRRSMTIKVWDDGEAVNQVDIEVNRIRKGKFVVA